jgi:DNA polymerase-4
MDKERSWIGHFDADAFFASVEQAADRRLRGRPVAVGGGQRGVVCSASYEARAYGVRGAMPVRRALQLCPQLCVVSGHFELYERFSEHIFGLCEDITPQVERGSMEEGFLDLGPRTGSLEEASRLLRELQLVVRGELRIGLSCGLSRRKQVARIAGKAGKPYGFKLVPDGQEAAFLGLLAPGALPGIGAVTAQRLERLGIRTLGQMRQAGAEVLYPLLGGRTAGLLQLAAGEDDSVVVAEAPAAQSFSGQDVLDEESGEEAEVLALARRLLSAQLVRLRAADLCARTLTLALRYTDYQQAQASHSLREPARHDPLFSAHLLGLLRRAWQRRVRVNQVRVVVSNLYPALLQGQLFGDTVVRNERLFAAMDMLNQKYGAGTVNFDIGSRGVQLAADE